MAYWDSQTGKIVESKPTPIAGYPGWVEIDCGCCSGLQWGGEQPMECDLCCGRGYYAKHLATGTLAEYPGGRLLGRSRLDRPEQPNPDNPAPSAHHNSARALSDDTPPSSK
jgi:hypothetical protein